MQQIVTYDRLGDTEVVVIGEILFQTPINGGPLYEARVKRVDGTSATYLVKPAETKNRP